MGLKRKYGNYDWKTYNDGRGTMFRRVACSQELIDICHRVMEKKYKEHLLRKNIQKDY